MKRLVALLVALAASAPLGLSQYSYFLTQNLYTPNWTGWTVNGSVTPYWYSAGGYGGLGQNAQGSALYGGGPYEVKVTYRNDPTNFCPSLSIMLASASDVQYENDMGYTVAVYGSVISLYGTIWNYTTNSAQTTWLAQANVTVPDNSSVRALSRPDPSGGNDVIIYVNNVLVLWYHDLGLGGGSNYYGVGANNPSWDTCGGNLFSQVQLGYLDITPPNAIPSSSITKSAAYNYVDLSWPAGTDNSGGSGGLRVSGLAERRTPDDHNGAVVFGHYRFAQHDLHV